MKRKRIEIKTSKEIEIMREGGAICANVLKEVLSAAKEGVRLSALEELAYSTIVKKGAKPSFTTVEDYPFATCINVNEGLVHGIPNEYLIKKGDLVSIDLGVLHRGFHTDVSYTKEISSNKEEKFLSIGKLALENAISKCVAGNKLGDVSHAMQETVEKNGYSVSRDLVGHGIGRNLHESPYVPGYGKKNKGLELEVGMVFALEIIYQKGDYEITLEDDGWTISTLDRSLGGLFEKTVAITNNGPLVLTPIH